MDEPPRARVRHPHLSFRLGLLRGRPLAGPLARNAPRLAAGLGLAAVLAGVFLPTVIRAYGTGGSLAGAVEPWMVAGMSVLANILVLAVASFALRGGRDRDEGRP